MEDYMTDKQFTTILEMVKMILEGCKDLEEANEKVDKLLESQKAEIKKRTKNKRGLLFC
ncbi:MAG: hypothetical protein LIP11_01060 [Clostridiales bacterium]|nr:hypothetical protein [Clostridiales bacterium]